MDDTEKKMTFKSATSETEVIFHCINSVKSWIGSFSRRKINKFDVLKIFVVDIGNIYWILLDWNKLKTTDHPISVQNGAIFKFQSKSELNSERKRANTKESVS